MKKLLLIFLSCALLYGPLTAGTLDNKAISTSTDATANGYLVVPMPDNGYLMASYDAPIIARADAQGQILWAKSVTINGSGYPPNRLFDAGILADSMIYLVYGSENYVYYRDTFTVAKLTLNGDVLWTSGFDFTYTYGGMYITPREAKPQPDGSLLFTTSMYEKMVAMDIRGDGTSATCCIIRDTTCVKNPCLDIVPADGGGKIFCGKDNNDADIVCVNSDYSPRWILHYTNGLYNRAYSILRSSGGNYFVAGYLADTLGWSTVGAFLMKVSPQGNVLWNKIYSGATIQGTLTGFMHLKENADGTLWALGQDYITSWEAIPDVFMKLDTNGQVLSSYYYDNYNSFWDARLYTTCNNETRLSTWEYDSTSMLNRAVYMNPDNLPSYCNAQPFSVAVSNTPPSVNLPNTNFTFTTTSQFFHPAVVTTDYPNFIIHTADLCLTTGIQELANATAFSISPNPATNQITISVGDELVGGTASITDITGRQIKISNIENRTSNIELSHIASGIYLVRITKGEKSVVSKLVVE